MNAQDMVKLLILFSLIFFTNKMLINDKNKYLNIILIIISITIFGWIVVTLRYNEIILGTLQYVYIQLPVLILGFIFISVFSLKTFKIAIDEIFLIIIISHSLITLYLTDKIENHVKFYSLLFTYIGMLFIALILKSIRRTYNYIKILEIINYVAIVNFGLSILQYLTGKKLLLGVFNKGIYTIFSESSVMAKRVVGFAGTNNAAGAFSAMILAITLYNYLRTKKKVALLGILSSLFYSALTLTRIGYLAIGIEFIIFFVMFNWNSRKELVNRVAVTVTGLIFIILTILLFGSDIYNKLFVQRGNTQQYRFEQYEFVSENIIPNNTFFNGIGLGQYRNYSFNTLAYSDIDMHSQYINILVEQGLFITIIFILLNICVLIKALKKANSILEKACVISLFVANLICCNFNPNQDYHVNNFMYYLLIYCFIYKDDEVLKDNGELGVESSDG